MRATGKRQQPFVYGSLSGRAIYLNQAEHPVAPGAAAPRAADETVWQAINQSNDAKLFENFVSRFPDSAHATDAQTRLADLQAANECDRLTASAFGKDHARNLGGSEAAGSDPDAAKRACDAAMRQFPGVARFAYQGGRTAEAGQDYALARTLYDTAAGEGSAAAMVSLGVLYESDRGGAQNFAQARDLYERAAALGDRQAELRLGSLYETGHGVDKDLGQARRWYEKSAALGEQTAMEKLSIFYQRGLGGPKSKAEARKWQKKAQSAGEQRTATSKAEQ
jgi:TPR repeat protein